MSLIEHAKRELATLRRPDEDPDTADAQGWIEECVLNCVEAFAKAGHSGSSAAYTTSILERLLRFEPLGPLTGMPDEWFRPLCPTEMHDVEQNKRCSHVFRENGQAYDIQAILWRDPDGTLVTTADSRRNVTFPYSPTQEIRDRPGDAPICTRLRGCVLPKGHAGVCRADRA
jgi:hypothetical protein